MLIQLTGHVSIASLIFPISSVSKDSVVPFFFDPLRCALNAVPCFISKNSGHTASHAPQLMHSSTL